MYVHRKKGDWKKMQLKEINDNSWKVKENEQIMSGNKQSHINIKVLLKELLLRQF